MSGHSRIVLVTMYMYTIYTIYYDPKYAVCNVT